MHIVVPTKADSITEKRSCNWGTVGTKSTGGIKMFLVLLGGLLSEVDFYEGMVPLL